MTPAPIICSRPVETPGMYSLGTEPPLRSVVNSKPEPGSRGSNLICTSAYWPEPPDCFLCVYLMDASLEMDSR